MFPDPTTTAFGPVPVPPGADQRAATAAANAHVEAALASGQDHLSQVLRGLGATEPVPFILAGTSTVPDVHAQLTVASFEFPRSELPDSVEFVGPLLPAPATGWVAPDWWAELDGATVVTVTQGTVANDDLSELIQPTLDALADQDVMVIAALGRDRAGTGLRVPANARVEAFVPFSELLPRSSVLITNGGYGATQQALAHGVPILVAGLTEDKAMVAARIGAFGVGIDLNTQRPEPDAIARACAALLSDPEYRTRARAIGADIAASDAQAAVAALLA
jgi:MGT family glycosyltransferase